MTYIHIGLLIILAISVYYYWEKIKKWKGWEIWLVVEGWKYITVNLVGNLFPVWFLLIIEFGNNGFTKIGLFKTIAQPYTYLVLLVAFASSTLYLWIKNIKSNETDENKNKNKISIGLILYVLFLFPTVGFYLNKKDCLENYNFLQTNFDCEPIVNVVYILFGITVFIYLYFQLKDFAAIEKLNKKSNPNPTANVKKEVEKLNEEL